MEMDIITRYCMALECAEIFSRYISRSSFIETKNKILMRYGAEYDQESRKEFDAMFQQLEDIYNETIKDIPDSEDVNFFFKPYFSGNIFSSIGYVMLVNFLNINASSVKDYMKSAIERARELLDKPCHIKMVAYSALILEEDKQGIPLRDNLRKDINNLEYDSEFKWNLYMVLSDFEEYAARLEKLLKTIESKLEKRLHRLDGLTMELAMLRRDTFDDNKISELADSMGLPEKDVRGKRVVLCMLCMPCHQLIMDEQWNSSELPMFLGIAAEWGNSYPKETYNRELLCEAIRIMGEESKFEILTLLSKGVACGKEIAANTGLDATTVSRHLNALSKYGLIRVDHKESRNVYYRTNSDEVNSVLNLIKEILCR